MWDLVVESGIFAHVFGFVVSVTEIIIDLRQATDIYYYSRLAEQISQGMYVIENTQYIFIKQRLS